MQLNSSTAGVSAAASKSSPTLSTDFSLVFCKGTAAALYTHAIITILHTLATDMTTTTMMMMIIFDDNNAAAAAGDDDDDDDDEQQIGNFNTQGERRLPKRQRQ